MDSGSTCLSHGFPSDSSYVFEAVATASHSSSSSQVHASVNPGPEIRQVICVLFMMWLLYYQRFAQGVREADLVYTVKVITSGCGSLLKRWSTTTRFATASTMKLQLKYDFDSFVGETEAFSFGYLQRGHGTKGRQYAITDDDNIKNMYEEYKGKAEILLWIKVHISPKSTSESQKRQRADKEIDGESEPKRQKSSSNYLSRLSEVQEIIDDLEERHDSTFTMEQLRVWAHMIHMRKHLSYTDPPDKPFFRKHVSKKNKTTSNTELSPVKRINLRTECINQLDKWHMLLEKGAITSEQYTQLQGTILGDIEKF